MENLMQLPLGINKPNNEVSNNKDFVFDGVLFDTETLAALQAVFSASSKVNAGAEAPKSASVKFMITMQDEINLRNLGYSDAQIDTLTPQEAVDIIQAGNMFKRCPHKI